MQGGALEEILARYGQRVRLLRSGEEGPGVEARAFLQPVLTRREDWRQKLPTPIGLQRRDQFLYLGEPGVSLEEMEGGVVLWGETRLEITASQPVYVGEALSHWWAVLTPGDEDGTW